VTHPKEPKTRKPATKAKPARKLAATPEAKLADDGIHPAARPFLWLGAHQVQRGFMWVIGALALIFVGTDFLHHRYGYFSWDGTFGFYAWYGFLSFAFVVLMGWPLRKLTSRPENYYGDEDKPDE